MRGLGLPREASRCIVGRNTARRIAIFTYKTFADLRVHEEERELYPLASCVNFAAGPGVDDGEACYIGRNPDDGSHLFGFWDIHGGVTFVGQTGVVLGEFPFNRDNERMLQQFLGDYEWVVAFGSAS